MIKDVHDLIAYLDQFIARNGDASSVIPDHAPASLREIYLAYGIQIRDHELFGLQNALHSSDNLIEKDGLVRFISENQGCDFFFYQIESGDVFSDLEQYEEPYSNTHSITKFPASFDNVLISHCLREYALEFSKSAPCRLSEVADLEPLFLNGKLDLGPPHHNFFQSPQGGIIMSEH